MDFVLITTLLNTLHIEFLERPYENFTSRHREMLQSLCDKIRNLQAFLEDSHNNNISKITKRALESEIGGVARDAEDKIQSELHQLYSMDKSLGQRIYFGRDRRPDVSLYQTLKQVNRDIKSIERRVQIMSKNSRVMPPESLYQTFKQVKLNITSIERRIQIMSKNNHSAAEPQRIENIKVGTFSKRSSEPANNNVMVGCDDQFDTIVCKLTSLSKQLQVISVVGMGGIGKTTLINKVFEDATIATHFDVRAWATVSQKHNLREMLIGLLGSDVTNGVDNNHLANQLRQKLMGQRYLIVMDDIWETKAWDDIHRCFPEDFNGSRILLTTRNKQVADYSAGSGNNNLHYMRFLNPHESWSLFYKKVFEEKNVSIEFETIGRGIVEKCQGLPLTIIVVAGLLTSFNEPSPTQWENIAENLNSFLNTHQEEKCSKILSLSYDHLPLYLKVCFLYFGVFPEDSMICVKKLIMLWVAEGFLKLEMGETMEKIGETYLQDLVDRGLVQIVKWSCDGKIKYCKLHDLLHNFCLEEARRENLLDVINESNVLEVINENNVEVARVQNLPVLNKPAIGLAKCLHPKYWIQKFGSKNCMLMSTGLDQKACRWISNQSIHLDFPITVTHTSHQEFSSILHFPKASGLLANYSSQTFPSYPKLLRVLDLSLFNLVDIPSEIVNLVSLRYLALRTNAPLKDYKWSGLQSLQTFIVEAIGPNAPGEVWKSPIDILDNMPQLRHVMFRKSSVYLPRMSVHYKLQTISCIYLCVQHCLHSVENLMKIPYLKKLGIYIDISSVSNPELLSKDRFSPYNLLRFLDYLRQLENLKIDLPQKINFQYVFRLPTSFPPNLKKLTLQGTCLPWDDMAIIATLPNLEALKLKHKAFCGSEWKTENGFCKLKYLKIAVLDFEHWSASFPVLECLILDFCRKLKKFPIGFVDITTLQLIELTRCNSSLVTSAKQIQKEQLECFGHDKLVIRDYCTFP